MVVSGGREQGVSEEISIRDAFGQALVELGEANPDVVVLDADVSSSTRTAEFAKRFPGRFINVGVAEANMMGIAAGLATAGKIPIASTFSFLACLRAGEQVRTSIAYPKLRVVIAGAYGGLSPAADGPSHHAISDVAIMRSIPNMTVVVVADAVETKKAVFAAASHDGPVFLRLSREGGPPIYDKSSPFAIGRANLMRLGDDVTLVANGLVLSRAIEAAEELEARQVSTRVIEMHTVKPLDETTLLRAASVTGALVTVEEHNVIGGLGSAVAEVLARKCPVPIEMVGIKDSFGQSGPYKELLDEAGLTVQAIVRAAEAALIRKRKGVR